MFRNIINYLSSGIINQVSTLFFWIVVAKYSNPEMLGEAHVYLLYVDLAVVFSIFGADSVIYKYYFSDKNKTEVFSASMLLALIGYLLFLLVATFFQIFNFSRLNSYLFFFLILQVFLNVCLNLIYAELISQKLSKKYLVLNIIRAFSFLIIAFLIFYFSGNKFSLQLTYISSLIIALYFNRRIFLIKINYRKEDFMEFFYYAVPFMLYGFSGIIHSYLNRLLALTLLSKTSFAIFAYFYIFYAAVESLLSNLNKSWTPFIFSKFKTSSSEVVEVMLFASSALIACYSLILFSFSFLTESGIIKYLLQDLYLKNINNLFTVLLAPIFLIYFLSINPSITYSINSKKMFLVNAFKVLFLSIVSCFLISKYSLIGASISVIGTSLFQLLLFLIFYRKTIKITPAFLLNVFYSIMIVALNFIILNNTDFSNLFRFSLLLHLLPVIILSYRKYFKSLRL
jgi:O-antigen/teichoic acid export membrane protein